MLNALHSKDAPKTPKQKVLAEVADHISTTERTAAEAENESQRLKQLEYLASLDEKTTFDAVITDIRPMGIFVELTDFYLRGLIREEDLPYEREGYYFDAQRTAFNARRGRRSFGLGDHLRVRVAGVDMERMLIDFAVAQPAN